MKTKHLLILIIPLVLMDCSSFDGNKGRAHIAPFEFDDKGLRVITTLLNNKAGTMSTLYGNAVALNTALEGNGVHSPGELFALVSWKQADNRFWYGSVINGPLERVEVVTTSAAENNDVQIKYEVIKGSIEQMNVQERIDFIFELRPSVFP